jgi:hypothetical protein
MARRTRSATGLQTPVAPSAAGADFAEPDHSSILSASRGDPAAIQDLLRDPLPQ